MALANGTKLGRYEIRSKIGEGGMGEVYLAKDTELDRSVALKILPEALASNQQRLQRFIQEARAASALNHPHILTIYEVGTIGDSRFIATEFIDGETLRQRMSQGMKLADVLEIAIETASALSAAHAAGIIHRDIKPENIMVRRDGYVKVLDFGLAKLSEIPTSATDPEAATRAMVNTADGMVMGTANYMSPEQAKGAHVDARTDIWSLGAMLYEMVAGRLPFPGETPAETISLILLKEPAPLTRFAPNAPDELGRIISKALTKDREERYQTIKDLLIDLRNLKRKLEVDAEIDRTVAPDRHRTLSTSGIQSPTAIASGAMATGQASSPHSASSAEYVVSGIKRHKLAATLIGVILLAGAVTLIAFILSSRNRTAAISSIAVMPFVNASGNPEVEYLSDGMTETLINSLSQLPNLNVKARSTVFRYKGKEFDPKKIASELNVQALLTGRVVQRGDQMTLSLELIDPATENVLWGNKYERKSAELIALQTEVARDVSNKLKPRLSGAEEAKLTKTYTTNPEAYQLYLKGHYFSRQFTLEGFRTGVAALNQAIALDPNYALAYAGLSDAYFYASTIHLPPTEALPKAEEYARKALALDDSLAAAHHSLANVRSTYERDFAGTRRDFDRAIELDPNDASIYFDYTQFLSNIGENEPAIRAAEQAAKIDPLDGQIATWVGAAYVMARRYDEALQKLQAAIRLDDKVWWTYYWQGIAYSEKGMHDKAIESLQTAAKLDDSPLIRGVLAHALARAGRRAEAQRVIDDLIELSKSKFVSQSTIAMAYAGLGEKDKAFEWLDKSYESHDEAILWLKNHPMFEPLRDDPRYKPMLKRLNLPE
jgi:serine/threonine protein kinase/tetratricopeptide (TPR) repeat protein